MSFMSDPVADMLSRIKNAYTANMDMLIMPYSRLKGEIARILEEEGYIKSHVLKKDEGIQGVIEIYLKYKKDNACVINGLEKISKPGLRVYTGKGKIPKVMGGYGTVIISTSKGILTGAKAKESGVGGEVICSIW